MMDLFKPVALDAATKRPKLSADEIELLTQDGVSVLKDDKEQLFEEGVLRLTSHQLIWVNATYSKAFGLSQALVHAVEEHMSGFIGVRRAQIRVFFTAAAKTNIALRLDFASGGRDKVLKTWDDCLKRKMWEKQKLQPEKKEFDAGSAGVAGIIRKAEQSNASSMTSVSQAFTDMDGLIRQADDLVKIAKKLERISKNTGAEGGQEGREITDVVSRMGIMSGVSKETCGSLFHEELARQVCEFLSVPEVKRVLLRSGFASLPDLYCAYNRARGTDLISPEDLMQACRLMQALSLPFRLKEFPSGVKVLEASDAPKPLDMIIAALEKKKSESKETFVGLRPYLLAEELGMSLPLAMEQLLLAEDSGLICRDETVEGLVFYKNEFNKNEQQ